MRLDDVADVVVDRTGGHKYIVVAVIDEAGNTKLIVRADKRQEYHMDIFDAVRMHFPGSWKSRCVGGGQIRVDQAQRTIEIWGSSGSYGVEPDRAQTARMLGCAFPEFGVIFE